MAIVDAQLSVWEALAGRAPGQPVGPADPGLWSAVAERLNPARAAPRLRPGIEAVELTTARGVPYVMVRSPDDESGACYLRLAPEEWALAQLMDGSRTLARLVAEFARITGRLAPDQVRRVVADLAGNRMLGELPVDAFAPLRRVHRKPWPLRLGSGLLAVIQGRRMVLANVDPLVTLLYRAGGRLLFTRAVAALLAVVAVVGLGAFAWQWWTGEQSIFLTSDSYVAGAAVLLGLNVFALACHELGHALATKHAGRRVPAAGFLVYFGIPSVFVDTSDVWMAGRRARLLTTAAGPATGLVLAGASALVGLAVPSLAPWCFKLSFAWYLNAMFNLNPFLALDGYYLLMDWLEVNNLRARGLAWVTARLRGRPPAFRALDREGRLVALYGLLALGWVVVALNIAYRVYADRVAGLATGLWRSGWPARLLLFAVIVALASPLVYVLCGWSARRLRRLRAAWTERRLAEDAPRRLEALRGTALRDLPPNVLAELAAASRWVHPRTGEQVAFAGAASPTVFAVVDGALEGRAPGDPVGTVRERVGAGGVVGIGAALAGAAAPLSWFTAGTTLLAIPSTTFVALVPPASGPYGTAAEVEQLLAASPGLTGLSQEDRLGLAAAAVPIALAPGAGVILPDPDTALVVASGTIATLDGAEFGRGTLIGPSGEPVRGPVATARSATRLFSVPAVAGLPLLLAAGGAGAGGATAGGRAPVSGAHPPQGYPPLAPPPGPPPPTVDDNADDRFERRLRWLLALVLLVALFFTGGNIVIDSRAWAEMPSDKVLLQVTIGTATATVDGVAWPLAKGDTMHLGAADSVVVPARSLATLTYRGGAVTTLCAGSQLSVLSLGSGGRPIAPLASLRLVRGETIHSTAANSPAFSPLALSVHAGSSVADNAGEAFFSVAASRVTVAWGRQVRRDGVVVPAVGGALTCGDGTVVAAPGSSPSASPSATPTPTPTPTPSPSTSPAPTPSPSVIPSASTTTTSAPPSASPSAAPTTPRPTETPRNLPPKVEKLAIVPGQEGATCWSYLGEFDLVAFVSDDNTPTSRLQVTYEAPGRSGTLQYTAADGAFHSGAIKPFGGRVTIVVYVKDAMGLETKATIDVCPIIIK